MSCHQSPAHMSILAAPPAIQDSVCFEQAASMTWHIMQAASAVLMHILACSDCSIECRPGRWLPRLLHGLHKQWYQVASHSLKMYVTADSPCQSATSAALHASNLLVCRLPTEVDCCLDRQKGLLLEHNVTGQVHVASRRRKARLAR